MSNSLKKDIERAQQILGTLPFLKTQDDYDLQTVIDRYYDLIDDADEALSEAFLLIEELEEEPSE